MTRTCTTFRLPQNWTARASLLLLFALFALTTLAPQMARADDTTPPTVTNAKISPTGTYSAGATLPTITISATITDNSGGTGVGNVYAQTSLNGSLTSQYTLLTKGSGNTYTGTLDLSYFGSNTSNTNRVYTVLIEAADNNGNSAPYVYASGSVTQSGDTTPPAITNAKISPTGTYSAGATLPTITITATVTDTGGSGVSNVYGYIYTNGQYTTGVELTKGSGNTYSGTLDLSTYGANTSTSDKVYTVQVVANDYTYSNEATVNAPGNITQSGDTTPPAITNAKISPTGTYSAGATLPTITITATVTDTGGSGVSNVYGYIYTNGQYTTGVELTKGSGNTYSGTLDLSTYGANTSTSDKVYTVQVVANDYTYNNEVTVTASGNITQSAPPAPKLTGATVTPNILPNGGATVTLKVSATPGVTRSIGTVRAEVYEDGTDIGYSDLNSTGGTGYSITRDIPAGDSATHLYSFVFTATDNYDVSSTVTRYAQQAGTNTLPVPTLTSISPTSGYTGTSVTLTLTGTNFSSSSVVLFDGFVVPATYNSATSLTCAVDKSFLPAVKKVNVQVYNPKPAGGTSGSKTFTINPTLSALALSPTSVAAGGTSTGTVTLSAAGLTDLTVTLTSNNAAAVVPASVVVPAGQTMATFPVTTTNVASSTAVTITAKLGVSKTATLTVPPAPLPTITSLSPSSATAGGAAFTLTVNGTNFVSGATINWNGTAQTTTYVSATQLTASISASLIATAGTATVTVTTPGGTSAGAAFTINAATTGPPTITSLSPNSATAGGAAFTLTVNGTNFIAGSVVKWNGTTQTTTLVSSTQLTASIPASLIAAAGTATVTVTTPHVGTSAGATFTINPATASAPVLTSISPTTRTAGGGAFVLTANGSNFISGSIIKWNGATQTTTFVSATKLTATIPASLITTAGTATITVTTPHVGTSGSKTLTINP